MTEPRVPEPDCRAISGTHAGEYDRMQAGLRESGWLDTGGIIEAGIVAGCALEVGSGPGHLGLDWLSRTEGTTLVGLDLSPEMVATAERHAREDGLAGRASYVVGDAGAIPFADGSFDAAFSSNSLHEWADPRTVLAELRRVLKPEGRLFLSDLRRDLAPPARDFLERRMPTDEVREGLRASIAAAYTVEEAKTIVEDSHFADCSVSGTPPGLRVTAVKPA